jgi:dienelactone hydrolase
MKKLFYFVLLGSAIISACNKSGTDTKNNLEDEAAEVEKGSFKTVTFLAEDSLSITADYYPNPDAKAIIVLLHQAGFSRGEYKDIAPRLVDSGYACLAVDLRSGNFVFDVINQTAAAEKAKGLEPSYLSAMADVKAAIQYAANNSNKEIYLWGSSYSAGLALIAAKEDERIKRVVAFSPGEYFSNQSTVRSRILGLNTPIFITGSNAEYDMIIKPLVEVLPKHNVITFKPESFSDHGSKTLWPSCSAAEITYAKLFEFL